MKKYVKSSNFISKMCLVDKYGQVVMELESDGGYYRIPKSEVSTFLLDEGDEYHVEEIEFEVD